MLPICTICRYAATSSEAGQSQRLIDVHCLSALPPIPTGKPDLVVLPLRANNRPEQVQQSALGGTVSTLAGPFLSPTWAFQRRRHQAERPLHMSLVQAVIPSWQLSRWPQGTFRPLGPSCVTGRLRTGNPIVIFATIIG
jgi:hypothetical protein